MMSETKTAALLEDMSRRQEAVEQALQRVVSMLVVHNEKLDAILEAASREAGPSPVVEALNGIAGALREQGDLLRELPTSLAETIRDELQRELAEEEIEMEEAEPGAFDGPEEREE